MTEVESMKIGIGDEMKPTINDPDQKKKPLKRKRLEPKLVLDNGRALLENMEKIGSFSASLNCMIACLMEESDLPLFKLVDEIFVKVKGRTGNNESVTKASAKSTVLMTGQRLCYGVASADTDILEDESECALWCWEV
ncbi:UNVERIFIED_CONTAM: Chromatin assembly factor 1 subunit FAS1 [Sesamum calycinum]|uniref:Chromatin assembly factor 1 subunit FAS1 n=1 Tax=Sesamum calycinum TaxID=2727403 RepID=A0AAW2LST5_9LAMI